MEKPARAAAVFEFLIYVKGLTCVKGLPDDCAVGAQQAAAAAAAAAGRAGRGCGGGRPQTRAQQQER